MVGAWILKLLPVTKIAVFEREESDLGFSFLSHYVWGQNRHILLSLDRSILKWQLEVIREDVTVMGRAA